MIARWICRRRGHLSAYDPHQFVVFCTRCQRMLRDLTNERRESPEKSNS